MKDTLKANNHRQATIQRPISCFGIGVHSGRKTQLTLKPAKENTGIVFLRTDLKELNNTVKASYDNVIDTSLSTTIANDSGVRVSTIEHLMAALWGCGVDNVIAELDGEEVPIMDGSSRAFVFMIECVGVKTLTQNRRFIKILKEITVSSGSSEASLHPSDDFAVDITIDFESKAIGEQKLLFTASESFKDSLADARTFGFAQDLEYLRSQGLAFGASLENVIGIEKDRVMNESGLRFSDEFVRHKLLDSIGDSFTANMHIIGKMSLYKPSHYINNLLITKLFECTDSYSIH